MPAQISPMLAANDGNPAIDFYKAAFSALALERSPDRTTLKPRRLFL